MRQGLCRVYIYILDAQMGAKAPILLDVRTSISDLEGKS